MTGLDETKGQIVEIACIVTEADLTTVAVVSKLGFCNY